METSKDVSCRIKHLGREELTKLKEQSSREKASGRKLIYPARMFENRNLFQVMCT